MYKLAKYKLVFVVIFTLAFGMLVTPAFALVDEANDVFGLQEIAGTSSDSGIALGNKDFTETITSIINVVLSLLGIVAVVIILAGGFKWMTAGGNEEKVDEARKLIFAGIIGIAIILSAWAIARFVLENLGEATGAISDGAYDGLDEY